MGDDGDKLPIKMLSDRLLVKIPREEGERRSSGGILIPATAQVARRLVWAEVMHRYQRAHRRTRRPGLFAPTTVTRSRSAATTTHVARRDIHAVAASRLEGSTVLYL